MTHFNIIAYDTSGSHLYIAVIKKGEIIDKLILENNQERYHTAVLLPTFETLLAKNNLSLKNLDALGVGIGPGSFTGIRTGVVIARTLGQFLKIPVIPFSTGELFLDGLYHTALLLDARRGQAYFASTEKLTPELMALDIFYTVLSESIQTIITDTSLYDTVYTHYSSKTVCKVEDMDVDFCSRIGKIVLNKAEDSLDYPWYQVEPLYLQKPGITVNCKTKISSV